MTESVCAQCAKGTLNCRDCCTSPFTDKTPGFLLTLPEIARIVERTRLNPDAFCRLVGHTDEVDESEELGEKVGNLIDFNNKTILMSGKGKCAFLGENGCTIFDIRPSICRIFPFWFNEENNTLTIEHEKTIKEDECLLTKRNYKSEDIPHLLSQMNETEEGMQNHIKNFWKDLEVHAKYKHQLEKKSILQVLIDNNLLDKNIKLIPYQEGLLQIKL